MTALQQFLILVALWFAFAVPLARLVGMLIRYQRAREDEELQARRDALKQMTPKASRLDLTL